MLKKSKALLSTLLISSVVIGCSTSEPANSSQNQSQSQAGEKPQASQPADSGQQIPEGGLEFIASYSPGGGHDTMLRTMAKVLADEKIIENPISVVNKPGGSGAVGMAYTSGREGESNYIMAVTSSLLTTPLQGGMNISYKDLTPIARLGLDPYVLVAKANTGMTSFEEYIKAAKEKEMTFGGTSIGSGEHMLSMQISEATQTNSEYVPFEGDGEVITALLGGHIDVTANNLTAAIEYIKNGDLVPLAVSSSERIAALPDVPTLKELGYDIDWVLFRGIYGPGNMPKEAAKWYEEKLKTLSENPKWKEEYLDKYMVEKGFLTGEEFKAYLDEMNVVYEKNLKQLGIIK